ncbi:unnamed protein product [Rhizophagus irregularis]|nr:unnamed protein product [Rhizophagus irregularis]
MAEICFNISNFKFYALYFVNFLQTCLEYRFCWDATRKLKVFLIWNVRIQKFFFFWISYWFGSLTLRRMFLWPFGHLGMSDEENINFFIIGIQLLNNKLQLKD